MPEETVSNIGGGKQGAPRRLLYFHQHFTTLAGTSGTRSYEFAKALVAKGWQVTMVCGVADASKLGLKPEEGAEAACRPCPVSGVVRGVVDGIHVIALLVPYSNRDGIARRLLMFVRFALGSARTALLEPCDLVFATSTPLTAAVPGILFKWLRRKPFVFEVRDLWPELPRAVGLKNPFLLAAMSVLEWLGYHAADALVGLSPGIVEGIKRRAPKGTPVRMLPNGCDLDIFKPREAARDGDEVKDGALAGIPGIEPGDFVAGFTGAHGIANGLDAVLDAAALALRRGEKRLKFLFVGDGNRKDSLVERARRENLENCVFLPPMPKLKLARLTSALDCGLMVLKNVPAFYRGTSPNKFFDYIAAGIPVLNNYPGWLAEMIEENRCGVVVPPDSPGAFVEGLLKLAASPDRNAAMRRAARSLAEREFSRDSLAAGFTEFLAGV
ncbi:MAG: glycosyltransferase family 4 protein [Puniceicoccales bacterium]|jgi:glycosyltransferase involved in cell wall biosynthesis|nr:glycosyltransferase family 4 protein [Puniceicoccales bacterium]